MDVLLINCDKTYSLDPVEDLVKRANPSVHNIRIEKQFCNVSELQAVSERVRKRRLLCGVFVANAYESRLSINEDKAGIGYAVLYRALLEAAQGRVLVVIGGDDKYKEGEQDTNVLSTWAYHKIAAQFDDSYLDGTRGFVFSWEERHNPIHEEALGSYLRAITSGQPGLQKAFKPSPPTRPAQPPTATQATTSGGPKSKNVGQHGRQQLSRPNPPTPLPPPQATTPTSEGLMKEASRQTEAHGDARESGAATVPKQQRQHTGSHGPDQTGRPRGQQDVDRRDSKTQGSVKSGKGEHGVVNSSQNVVHGDPLGATAVQTSPPQDIQTKHSSQLNPVPQENKGHTPKQGSSQPSPAAQNIPALTEEAIGEVAKYLKEKMESDNKGRTVKSIDIYVWGDLISKYDYPKSADVFQIPSHIQDRIDEEKGKEALLVVVIIDDGPDTKPLADRVGSMFFTSSYMNILQKALPEHLWKKLSNAVQSQS